MTYATQRYLAIAVAIILTGLALVQADPAGFGLSAVVARWIGLAAAMLGVGAGFLPNVRALSKDPEFLLHRIEELPPEERQKLAATLADRAASIAQ